MRVVIFLLLQLLLSFTPELAEPSFDEKYERDYISFTPAAFG